VGKVCHLGTCCDHAANCAKAECGTDGCGGSCGKCQGNQQVCVEGMCACQPACDGKDCGPDGCGGTCGWCDDGLECTGDICNGSTCLNSLLFTFCLIGGGCVPAGKANPANPCESCQPLVTPVLWSAVDEGEECGTGKVCHQGECCDQAANCAAKECGGDGCGGTCGECSNGEACVDGVCLPKLEWVVTFGAQWGTYATTLLQGADGTIFIGGRSSGPTVDFGDGEHAVTGVTGAYIVKLDAAGTTLWSRVYSGDAADSTEGLAPDSQGGVFAAGALKSGQMEVGGVSLKSVGGDDVFVVRLNKDGGQLWAKSFGGSSSDLVTGIDSDGQGGFVIVGHSQSQSFSLGGDTLINNGSPTRDGFIARMSSEGEHLWSMSFGDDQWDRANAVSVDGAGNIFVVGYMSGGDVDLGNGPMNQPGLFVLKLDGDGNHLWSKVLASGLSPETVAPAPDGSLYLAGTLSSAIVDLGAGVLPYSGSEDAFVVKLDGQGNHLWSTAFGGDEGERVTALAVDGMDGIVATGWFRSNAIDPGGGPLSNATEGNDEIFVARFLPAGGHVMSKAYGGIQGDQGVAIAVGPGGKVLVHGRFSAAVDFGGGPVAAIGVHSNVFLLKLSL